MHKTTAGEKRKALKAEAQELAREAKAVMKASMTCRRPGRRPRAGRPGRQLAG